MRAGSTVLLTAMSCMASGERPARCAAAAMRSRICSTFSRMPTDDQKLLLGAWSLQLGAVFQRLAGKVIQGKCQQQKGENRNAIGDRHVLRYGVGQRILRQPIARFDQLQRDSQQPNYAAGGDQSA